MNMEIVPGYQKSLYMPFNKYAKLQDCKMAAVYEDKDSGTIYYEYATNEVQLKNLANSKGSGRRDNDYLSKHAYSAQPRLRAYDHRMYNDHHYIPRGENIYDNLHMDYAYEHPELTNIKMYCDNESFYAPRSKSRSGRNSTRSRSKSIDRKRKKLPLYDNFTLRDDLRANEMMNRTMSRNRNCSAPVYNISQYDLHNSCGFYSNVSHFPQGKHLDSNYALWQQYQRPSRDAFCSFQAFSPSSPLDSGLSSQSVASSPSLEAEPLHARRIPECGSPVMITAMHRNQCSCSTNSCSDPNVLSPPIRSDSGRSSPWTQSAVLRLNALTEAKNMDFPFRPPPLSNTVTLSTEDFDQKRYSMSGIYVAPRNKNLDPALRKGHDLESEPDKTKMKQYVNGSTCNGDYVSNKDLRTSLRKSQTECPQPQVTEQFQPLEVETRYSVNRNKEYHDAANLNEFEKGLHPESSLSLENSSSPTDLSSSMSNKSDGVSRISTKKFSKSSEKAICELEEMYNKLNLQDYDLLDRAERRDLPTQHQEKNANLSGLSRSKSDSFFEILGPNYCNPFKKPTRAPPMRRSGIPDLIADDMAMRKLQKPELKPYQAIDNSSSYLLYSSHFTPSLPVSNEVWLSNRPDVEYDDFSFRRYFHLSSGKVEEPQPPFGIPLNPNPPQSVFSDYLHVVPSGMPQPICHPRGNPDLVRDDLAFRTLRKDNPERAMYDSYSLFYRKVR